jgi:hypothetical protein
MTPLSTEDTSAVSESELLELRNGARMAVENFPSAKNPRVKRMYAGFASACDELLAARARIAELEKQLAILVPAETLRLASEAMNRNSSIDPAQSLTEFVMDCPLGEPAQLRAAKCERCGGRKRVLEDMNTSARNPAKPDEIVRVQQFVPCPDCNAPAQPRLTDEILDDGFGSTWKKCGPKCRMNIVRPGKVQCDCWSQGEHRG